MKKPKKVRADALIVERGYAESEKEAQALVMTGRVMVIDGQGRERKLGFASELVSADSEFRRTDQQRAFVSRAGTKLAHALDAFSVRVEGRVCADIGVSTGGFTDCLLQRGATQVFAVDVGYGDIAWKLRGDDRVTLFERTNARTLPPDAFGTLVDLVVMDVSFISLRALFAPVFAQCTATAEAVVLVKPQFEARAEEVPGGVVRDEDVRKRVLAEVETAASALGWTPVAATESPIQGRDGNVELLLHLRRSTGAS